MLDTLKQCENVKMTNLVTIAFLALARESYSVRHFTDLMRHGETLMRHGETPYRSGETPYRSEHNGQACPETRVSWSLTKSHLSWPVFFRTPRHTVLPWLSLGTNTNSKTSKTPNFCWVELTVSDIKMIGILYRTISWLGGFGTSRNSRRKIFSLYILTWPLQ